MSGILSFLNGIGEAIAGAFNFLLGIVSDLVFLVQLLGRFISLIPTYFQWLPSPILGLITSALTIAIILKIIGRD